MDVTDQYGDAWEGIRNGAETGRLAHAYVIEGSPRGNALEFAESFLKLLFCKSAEKPCNECVPCRQIDAHKHADALWIEPQSKARQILKTDVELLIRRISQTAFEGGWKAGVILSADCMNVNSANALLKTLEEPPPKSLLLLVTDSPQGLLPTIISRCQKITLSAGRAGSGDSIWAAPLKQLLLDLPPSGGLDASRLAGRLKGIFDTVKAEIADAVEDEFAGTNEAMDESKVKVILEARINSRLKEVQGEVFRVILDWHRDVLMLVSGVDSRHLLFPEDKSALEEQAQRQTPATVLKAIRVVEGMAERLSRNIPATQIFDEAFRKLTRSAY